MAEFSAPWITEHQLANPYTTMNDLLSIALQLHDDRLFDLILARLDDSCAKSWIKQSGFIRVMFRFGSLGQIRRAISSLSGNLSWLSSPRFIVVEPAAKSGRPGVFRFILEELEIELVDLYKRVLRSFQPWALEELGALANKSIYIESMIRQARAEDRRDLVERLIALL